MRKKLWGKFWDMIETTASSHSNHTFFPEISNSFFLKTETISLTGLYVVKKMAQNYFSHGFIRSEKNGPNRFGLGCWAGCVGGGMFNIDFCFYFFHEKSISSFSKLVKNIGKIPHQSGEISPRNGFTFTSWSTAITKKMSASKSYLLIRENWLNLKSH